MATIRNLGTSASPSWNVQIRKKGQKPLSKTFKNKRDAQAWAKKIESEIEQGIFLDTSESQQTTLSEVLTRYQTEVLPTKKSQKTVVSQIKILSNSIGYYSLSKITPSVLSAYRDNRLQMVDPQTVRKDLSLLQRIFNTCMKDWGIYLPHGNPVTQVRMPKQPQGRDRRLSVGEEDKLLNSLKNTTVVLAIVQIALETGMRREEICNIEWKDIDFKKKILFIPKTKTDTPRTIPLSSKAIEVLQTLYKQQSCSEVLSRIPRRIGRLPTSSCVAELHGKVFDIQPHEQSSARVFDINPHSVTQAFDRACKRANIEDLRFHDLRHEATSRFFEKGFNIMEVSSITGHKDLKSLKRYTHLKAETLVNRLG